MFIPHVHQRVRLEGCEGYYSVVVVDIERRSADLMRVDGAWLLLEDIPWSRLSPELDEKSRIA